MRDKHCAELQGSKRCHSLQERLERLTSLGKNENATMQSLFVQCNSAYSIRLTNSKCSISFH